MEHILPRTTIQLLRIKREGERCVCFETEITDCTRCYNVGVVGGYDVAGIMNTSPLKESSLYRDPDYSEFYVGCSGVQPTIGDIFRYDSKTWRVMTNLSIPETNGLVSKVLCYRVHHDGVLQKLFGEEEER